MSSNLMNDHNLLKLMMQYVIFYSLSHESGAAGVTYYNLYVLSGQPGQMAIIGQLLIDKWLGNQSIAIHSLILHPLWECQYVHVLKLMVNTCGKIINHTREWFIK